MLYKKELQKKLMEWIEEGTVFRLFLLKSRLYVTTNG